MHLELIDPTNDAVLSTWDSTDLESILAQKDIILTNLLPGMALAPLADWTGLDQLKASFSTYLASFNASNRSIWQQVIKRIEEMNAQDWTDHRNSPDHSSGTDEHGFATETYRIQIPAPNEQRDTASTEFSTLMLFLMQGVSKHALLKNDAYLPLPTEKPDTEPTATPDLTGSVPHNE